MRFYGWSVERGSCSSSDPSSSDLKTCNADGDEFGYGFGTFIHSPNPFYGDHEVPFNPAYDTWYNNPADFTDKRNNKFVSHREDPVLLLHEFPVDPLSVASS